jgi:peptide/nickel transport system ATP-binding protein
VFAALPAAQQEKCLTLEPPLEPEQAVAGPASSTPAASGAAPDQQFACFYPDGELAEDLLVVHEPDPITYQNNLHQRMKGTP